MGEVREIVIGNDRVNINKMARWVRQDIDFLDSQIARLESKKDNQSIADTYREMRDMRASILDFLATYREKNVAYPVS